MIFFGYNLVYKLVSYSGRQAFAAIIKYWDTKLGTLNTLFRINKHAWDPIRGTYKHLLLILSILM